MVVTYSHEPFTNFKEDQNKKAFQKSLELCQYPAWQALSTCY